METFSREENVESFTKLRRKKWEKWEFLADGEWSKTPYHEGNTYWEYALTNKRDYLAILSHGFPRRIDSMHIKNQL